MKATDLMLGDWVTFADALKAGEFYPIMITSLTLPDRIAGYHPHPAIEGSDVYGEEDLVGIPLTPEILEKNGFEADEPEEENSAYRLKEEGVIIVECFPVRNGYRGIFAYEYTRLRKTLYFVHELQHALRLCGIEKEIEL